MALVDKALFKPTPAFRARRKRVLVRVWVHGPGGLSQDVMVRDISATGMSAVARAAPPTADDIVKVTLPDSTTLWGLVRWVEGKAFGVEFDPASREGSEPAQPALPGSP